jgi:hypothetical protein
MSQGSFAEWRRLFYCRALTKQADISHSITKTGKEARVANPVKRAYGTRGIAPKPHVR